MNSKKKNKKYKYWSVKETSLLKNLYPKTMVKDLGKIFPGRSSGTIVAKAQALKLPSAKLWQPNEDTILQRHFYNGTKEKLLKLLPKRSWLAILARGERLGLKRNRNKCKLNINEDYFKKWSSNMAYILGFILADGNITKGTYKGYSDGLYFGVRLKDVDILEKIKKELSAEHALSFRKNAVFLSINSQKIVDSLRVLDISYRKSLCEKVTNVPRNYIQDFIRGFIDGDGSISFNKKMQPRFKCLRWKRNRYVYSESFSF